jgi:hypothetical protein
MTVASATSSPEPSASRRTSGWTRPDGVVLDGAGQHADAGRIGGAPRPVEPLDRQVVGLGAAGGEHDLARPGVERLGDDLPGLLDDAAGAPPHRMQGGRVPQLA